MGENIRISENSTNTFPFLESNRPCHSLAFKRRSFQSSTLYFLLLNIIVTRFNICSRARHIRQGIH